MNPINLLISQGKGVTLPSMVFLKTRKLHLQFSLSLHCCLSSVVCCLSSVVCCLSSVACHLLSVVCRLLFVVCHLSSVVCHLLEWRVESRQVRVSKSRQECGESIKREVGGVRQIRITRKQRRRIKKNPNTSCNGKKFLLCRDESSFQLEKRIRNCRKKKIKTN
jgi:hypothetical protein